MNQKQRDRLRVIYKNIYHHCTFETDVLSEIGRMFELDKHKVKKVLEDNMADGGTGFRVVAEGFSIGVLAGKLCQGDIFKE